MEISKLDAAKRQIDTAILLYFRCKDPVSIHTLASAGRQILYDITKHTKIKSIFDQLMDTIKPEKKKEVMDKLTEAKNFFKHAKDDKNEILARKPEQNEWVLRDAIQTYNKITQEWPEYMKIYNTWRYISNADIVADPYKDTFKKIKQSAYELGILNNKEGFFEGLLPIISKF